MCRKMKKAGAVGTATDLRDSVQATSTNNPESKSSLLELQACHLTRRCAISFAMASIVAPLLHGEAR